MRRGWRPAETCASRRSKRATYGVGTWILGGDVARAKVAEEEAAPEEKTSGRSTERAKLEDRIERYMRNQSVTTADSGREGEDPQEFWESWTGIGRAGWITAAYAEQSGEMTVVGATFRPCRECGGTGFYEVMNMGGTGSGNNSSRLFKCELCHGVAIIRRVSYR